MLEIMHSQLDLTFRNRKYVAVWWRESAAGANPGPLLSTQLANKIYTRRKIPACHPASLRNIDGCTRQHARSNQVFHQIPKFKIPSIT